VPKAKISDIRRREIIETAYKVFAEKGYHNTSMADIAAELEVGHGTLYRYFNNKLDIASSVTDLVIEKVTEVVIEELPADVQTLDDYREQMRRIGNRFFDLQEESPALLRILFYESSNIDPVITRKIEAAYRVFAAFTEAFLQVGIQKGFLKPDIHTYEAAQAINGMLFATSWAMLRNRETSAEYKQAWQDTLVTLILDGLALQAPAL
jgi:AcrR family transcriptional regulator